MARNAPAAASLKGSIRKLGKAKLFGLPAPLVIAGGVGVVYLLHKRSQAQAASGDGSQDGSGDFGGSYTGDAAAGGAGYGAGGAMGGGGAGGGGTFISSGAGQPVNRVVRRRVVNRIGRKVVVNAPNAKRVHVGPNRVVRRPLPRAGGGITRRPAPVIRATLPARR